MTSTESSRATPPGDWKSRLAVVVELMRDMSRQTDPQEMVRQYAQRVRTLLPADRWLALSRRGLEPPKFRITRSSQWQDDINPWRDKHRLPVLEGGLLAELIYSDAPRVIDDFRFAANDPAAEYLQGMRSLMAIPNYDQGVALNMTLRMSERTGAFDREELPEMVWMGNLFGRATHNLVLSEELREAYAVVDRELRMVADIQRALLPEKLPEIPTMRLAAHYQTARRAGGDYYDFFALPDGRWAVLIADASGHGTPAAVMMAITHSIAHSYHGPLAPAPEMLGFVNQQLAAHYTASFGSFVTAFYGIYNPATRELSYSSAGHNPPRLKRCRDGSILSLDGVANLPLGISGAEKYRECTQVLVPGDQIIFYTDGITEAQNGSNELFGLERLDQVLSRCRDEATELIQDVLDAVRKFTNGQPPGDDRTLLVAKIT